jgi:hypothetical protein
MYLRDVKEIKKHVDQTGPQGIVDVYTVVIASIRTPFYKIKPLSKDIKQYGLSSKAIWGNKISAYNDILALKEDLYDAYKSNSQSDKELLQLALKVKGLGLAKASFGLQMLGCNLACLDVHNLRLLGYKQAYFNNKSKIDEYISVVQDKGAEYWWDHWCNMIPESQNNRKHFNSADLVSKEHVEAVTVKG